MIPNKQLNIVLQDLQASEQEFLLCSCQNISDISPTNPSIFCSSLFLMTAKPTIFRGPHRSLGSCIPPMQADDKLNSHTQHHSSYRRVAALQLQRKPPRFAADRTAAKFNFAVDKQRPVANHLFPTTATSCFLPLLLPQLPWFGRLVKSHWLHPNFHPADSVEVMLSRDALCLLQCFNHESHNSSENPLKNCKENRSLIRQE